MSDDYTKNTGVFGTLNVNNRLYNRVEPLITIDQLKASYLFGVTAVDDAGNSMTDETLQMFLDQAISYVEHYLDITVMPSIIEEQKDYFANDYWEWGYMQLNRIPIIKFIDLKVVYLRDQFGLETVLDIPFEWIRLDKATGILRLVPNNRFPANLQVDGGGAFFPELFRRYSTVPSLWVVKYSTGFEEGKVPAILNAAIAMLASIPYLNQAGELILGAGIAGTSLSLDGLSQSIQSTASAENHAYSARIKEYNKSLWGDNSTKGNGLMVALRDFYKGQGIQIV